MWNTEQRRRLESDMPTNELVENLDSDARQGHHTTNGDRTAQRAGRHLTTSAATAGGQGERSAEHGGKDT